MIKQSRYEIRDWYVYDRQAEAGSKGFYIREILDSGCTEYKRSGLSDAERYAIIDELGLDVLAAELKDCFTTNHKPYDAEREAAFSYLHLCNTLGLVCKDITISEDTAVGSFGLNWKGQVIPHDVSEGTMFAMHMVDVVNQD